MAKKKKVTKKKAKKKAPKQWTKAEVNLLKKLFPTNPTSKIAKKFGRKTDTVKKKASRMGLRKSKRYLKSIGRA
jgi:allophanate hydrolase subunit 2